MRRSALGIMAGQIITQEGLPPPSTSGKVYDILLGLIVSFRLKPFALLSEKAVSDALHVSRSPVREALARLAGVGLVQIYAQRGSIVAPLRVQDLQHSQFLRECVEVGLLERACQLSNRAAVRQRLRSEIALQSTLSAIGDHERFAQSDELFHQTIATAVGLPNIWSDISNAKLHMNRFRTLTFPDLDSLATIIAQHEKIATAIGEGNDVAARDAMREHLRKIFPLIPELMKRFPDYFDAEGQDSIAKVHRPDLRFIVGSKTELAEA